MTDDSSTTNPHHRLDDAVYYRLRKMLLAQELPGDEIVNQTKLSEQLQVSRTPLRRALARLESDGLLVRTERGWYPPTFSPAEIASIFEIRAVLEGLACRLAAPHIGRDQLAGFRVMFEEAVAAARTGDLQAYYDADVRFHHELLRASGNRLLISTTQTNQILSRSFAPGLFRDPNETYPEHLAIIRALESRDGDQAEQLMREHGRRTIPHVLKRHLVYTQGPGKVAFFTGSAGE